MNAKRSARRQAAIEAEAAEWASRREGGLSVDEQCRFDEWLGECDAHAEALARAEAVWRLLDRPDQSGRGGEMIVRLAQRARSRRRRAVGISASVAACVVLGWFVILQPVDPGPAPKTAAIVLAPEIRALPDGGRVELREGAEIVVDYSGHLRRVELKKGDALFHVAKSPDRPFVVRAGGLDVRAVGTAFLVQLSAEQLDVVVTHGRVAVEPPPEDARPAMDAKFVSAGERVAIQTAEPLAAATVQAVSEKELAEWLAWVGPRVEFNETPLAEAVALINRHSKVQLVVADPKLARVAVNGLFRADNSEAMVRLLVANFGAAAERDGDTVTLRSR